MAELARPFFTSGVEIDPKAAAKHLDAAGKAVLGKARESLAAVTPWAAAGLDGALKALAESAGLGLGKVAQPVRVAVSGGTVSPGIGETLELIGRDESLRRLDAALR
jgi:glutamyl-tRNA synthetase